MAFEPVRAAEACIRRSRRFLTLASDSVPDSRIKNDLRRSAVVTVVAGIDSYMHWLVYKRLSALRGEGDLPRSFAKLDIPFTELASLADSVVAARSRNVHSRPWVKVKNTLHQRLLKETFQSYDQVATAFALAGIEKGWTRVAAEMGLQPAEIKTRLGGIVHRRNQIVHEADISRSSRLRQPKYNSIQHTKVESDVDWVELLIKAIEKVVSAGHPP
jgi:RiboL-PSP-HEPN